MRKTRTLQTLLGVNEPWAEDPGKEFKIFRLIRVQSRCCMLIILLQVNLMLVNGFRISKKPLNYFKILLDKM